LGTSPERILEAALAVHDADGVLLLVDLGSAVMSAEVAVEWLPDDLRERAVICGAPLVEGAIVAATSAAPGVSALELAGIAESAREFPKNVGPVPAGPERR
jgi:phosphocarrier protein FPr